MGLIVSQVPVKQHIAPPNLKLPPKPKKIIESYGKVVVKMSHGKYWKEVARAKTVNKLLATQQGTVTSREVINFMIDEGTFVVTDTSNEHWISSIWNQTVHGARIWEETGEHRWEKSQKTQGGKPYNIVWRLKAWFVQLVATPSA